MPRVLIAETETLLGAAIQNILAGDPDLDVVCISAHNQAELVQEIDRWLPQIVILNDPSHLVKPAQLLTYLKGYPKLRLVVVNVDHSLVRIYDKQEVLLKRAADFSEILRVSHILCG